MSPVTQLSGGHCEALAEIARAAASGAPPADAAAEVLEALRALVPYAAASLQTWNPLAGSHETLASSGYPPDALDHLDGWFVEHDEAYRYMRDVDPRPLRWRDMPFDYRRLHSASSYWIPLGFEEGATTCLQDSHGRHTGNLHLNTDSRLHPDDGAAHALLVLQRMLAPLADPLRDLTAVAQALEPNAGAVVITTAGETTTVPGRSAGAHLIEGAALLQHVRRLSPRHPDASFAWRDEAGGWHRVRLLRTGSGLLVTERSARPRHHVTGREVDVLTLVAEGLTNPEIAARLGISRKTVAKHVEHLLEKLGCPSRASLAVVAQRDGIVWLPGAANGSGDVWKCTPSAA